ncbi:MAG: hypothetical protein JWM31_2146 [Solirubrobacterales bacterium]|nr:hypothetical protein [Solirubrobacterales bacterium]
MSLRVPLFIVAALLLASVTLLFPSSPTYDPWAWIVWGREVAHLDLSTVDGPSWKPLPVFFTTPFALFGDAAPALWLVIARAGAICAVGTAFVLGRRLGGVIAGAGAAGGLLLAPGLVRNAGLGNSEGLMAAAVLAAVDRHVAGRHRQAFAFGIAASLLRPEAWPFLGLYALWLLHRDGRGVLGLVLGGIGCQPVLWFLPELWGSGDILRASDRAQQPLAHSPAFSSHPAIRVLEDAAHLVTIPAWIGVGLLVVLLASGVVTRERARPVAALAILALAWVAEVAVMTERGYSGNQRYLVVPGVLMIVVAATGFGWAADALAESDRHRRAAFAVVAAVAFAVPSVGRLGGLLDELRYDGRLPHRLAEVVDAAGGRRRLLACGRPYTGPFEVPAVAWQLRVHTTQVGLDPVAPAVVFRVRTRAGSAPTPSLAGLLGRRRTLARAPGWQLVGACR